MSIHGGMMGCIKFNHPLNGKSFVEMTAWIKECKWDKFFTIYPDSIQSKEDYKWTGHAGQTEGNILQTIINKILDFEPDIVCNMDMDYDIIVTCSEYDVKTYLKLSESEPNVILEAYDIILKSEYQKVKLEKEN